MDPLSISASTIAILQLTGKVIQLLTALASLSIEARALAVEITTTRALISSLKELAAVDEAWNERLQEMAAGPLLILTELLQDLETKLLADDDQSIGRVRKWGRKITWPFRMEETRGMTKIARNVRSVLAASLAVDQLAISREIQQDTNLITQGIGKLQIAQHDQERDAILRWLSSIDMAAVHKIATSKHVPTTGDWLINSAKFSCWLDGESDFMWIHGIPGSGKTVLCSTIIDHVEKHCHKHPSGESSCVYFYFAFDDKKRQTLGNFVRSLLAQLCRQGDGIPTKVRELFADLGRTGQEPTLARLTDALCTLLKQGGIKYLIIDALDECGEQEEVINLLSTIKTDDDMSTRVLVTSRAERQIETGLQPLVTGFVGLQGVEMNQDIQALIRWVLMSDPKLKTRPLALRMEIEQALMQRADGMFRWAACQLDTLRSCLSPSTVRKALQSLPRDLDKTYDRILCGIDEESRHIAFKALQFLAFSVRPVSLGELAEIVAILPGTSIFTETDRPFDPRDVVEVCSSLVASYDNGSWNQLAHYSVKEYLVSDRIRHGPASYFAMSEAEGHVAIADRCLTYLLSFELPVTDIESYFLSAMGSSKSPFPLIDYAVLKWARHAREIPHDLFQQLEIPILSLLDRNNLAFRAWMLLYRYGEEEEGFGSPLHYAAELGLLYLVQSLVQSGADINEIGGYDGSALAAAISSGHENIVRFLLDIGADINLATGYYGCALQAAAARGQPDIAMELIGRGADVNIVGGQFGTALQAAARYGRESVVEALLERGADVNATGGYYCTALQAAARGGHLSIVQTLLKHGANAAIQGGFCGNALQAAHSMSSHDVVAVLEAVDAEKFTQ
ncbi:hypothetical protein BDW59DRAFT_156533 [Aspergillus cavernicola]|uniref:Nephrocystin 3-like N-terminal domain-containing protein n=1 Tax=Aspergillus cavernicola TaxID=176166 RepID=A0ABR4J1K2_9EURO